MRTVTTTTVKTTLDAPSLDGIMSTPLDQIDPPDAVTVIARLLDRDSITQVDVARFMSSI